MSFFQSFLRNIKKIHLLIIIVVLLIALFVESAYIASKSSVFLQWTEAKSRKSKNSTKNTTSVAFTPNVTEQPDPNTPVSPGECDRYGSVVDTASYLGNSDLDKKYQSVFNNLFTEAVVIGGHIWLIHENGLDSPNWDFIDKIVDPLVAKKKNVKLHALAWHQNKILKSNSGKLDWYKDLPSNAKRQEALKAHIQSTIKHFKGRVKEYDLVNHAATHGPDDNFMLTGLSRVEATKEIFKWAREADPNAKYYINETIETDDQFNKYVKYIRDIQRAGVRPDAIGVMEHHGNCTGVVPSMVTIIKRFDTLGQFNIPIHVTEHDIGYHNGFGCPSDSQIDPNQPFKGYINWFQYQGAQYQSLISYYRSNDKIKKIILWGFTDYSHWRKDAGLLDSNLKEKPAYNKTYPLIRENRCK